MAKAKAVEKVSIERAAEIHGCTIRRMQVLASQGRIVGAEKFASVWMIPLPLTITPATSGPALRPRKKRA